MRLKKAIYILLIPVLLGCHPVEKPIKYNRNELNDFNKRIQEWQSGYLDIHHINTGSGNSAFFVLPDGTTMLFDAGSIDKEGFEKKYAPLKATAPVLDDSKTAAGWLANYIKQVIPAERKLGIDYALISHFHSDHYGSFMELGRIIPFGKIIDRNSPNLDFPLNLADFLKDDLLFQEYLSFISDENITVQSLKVGSDSQIHLLNHQNGYPTFKVRNVKSNATIWTSMDNDTYEHFTGGDNTGLQGFGLPEWFDVETPMAKAVGEVEVTTLNHHGNRDATNEFFVKTLNPNVVIQQLWCSDHPGQEVYQRLIHADDTSVKRNIFSTNIHPETMVTYGPWFRDNYKSLHGHIVVRVESKGATYKVYILDETSMAIKQEFGPYESK